MTILMEKVDERDAEMARAVFAGAYLHGECVALAIALHRRTGWGLIASRGRSGELLHAGVRTPTGRCLDVRGEMSDLEFMYAHGGVAVTEADEGTLLREDPKIGEGAIRRAANRLPILFPGVSGESEQTLRMKAFAADLEALCRRHGIWLRDDGLHGMIAYEGDGAEDGFTLSLGPTGETRLRRSFGGHDDDMDPAPRP